MALLRVEPHIIDTDGNFVFSSATVTSNVIAGNVKTDNLLYANGTSYKVSSFTNDAGYLVAANLTSYATQSYVGTQISNLVDAAPATLNTLNELAAALGDDANFATTITNSIGNKLSTSDFNSTANTWLGTKTTSNVSEGTNLYFTDTRANSSIDARVTKTFVDNLSVVANVANVAYSVAVANVTGIGNIATINLNGNASTILYGNGTFATAPVTYNDSNVQSYLPTYGGNLSPGNLTVTTSADLGDVANIKISGGTANYVLQTDGTGNLSWVSAPTGDVGTATVDVNIKTFTANGVQTSFTLDAAPAASKLVTVNYDGVVLLKSDYTVNGANVEFDTPPANGSKLEITTLTSGSGSGSSSGAYTWNEASANITMQTFNAYFVDTSVGPITMTLPATPAIGDSVKINDMAGTFATNNLTIGRNSKKIQGVADDLIVDYNQATMELVYCNSTYGWKVIGL